MASKDMNLPGRDYGLAEYQRRYSVADAAERIRLYYNIPARPEMEVLFRGVPAVITAVGGDSGMTVWLKRTGDESPVPCHPTWEITYPDDNGVLEGDPRNAAPAPTRKTH